MPRPKRKPAERASRIDIRCAEHERDRWHAAAAGEGLQLSDWIRRTLDRRAEDTRKAYAGRRK